MFENSTVKLVDLCTEVSYGYTASANEKKVGPKFLRITDIQGGEVEWGDVPFCEIDEKNLERNRLTTGDIVVARTGNSTGENYLFDSDEEAVFASYLIKFRIDQELANPYFVWLQMRTNNWWNYVAGSKSGSAQAGANAKVLGQFEFFLPERHIQDKAAEIILGFNQKLVNNRQTNQTLEHIAQAIFKCWFVDFEPTRAKIIAKEKGANTAIQELAAQAIICGAMTLEKLEAITQNLETTLQQAINEKLSQANQTPINTEQLKTTAALFPDALVDSELGEIPEGWEVLSISDFGKVITGKTPPKKIEQAYDNAGVPFITPTDIEDSVFLTSTNRFLTAEGQLAIKNTKIEAGTICVTCIGSQMGKAIVTPKDAFTNQQINSIAVYDDSFRNYLLLNLRNRREEIYDIGSSGSTMPIINKTTFEKLDVISPSLELLKRFDLVVEFNMKQILNGSLENIRLSDIRDLLLPQLLSGELLDSELVGGL